VLVWTADQAGRTRPDPPARPDGRAMAGLPGSSGPSGPSGAEHHDLRAQFPATARAATGGHPTL